MMTVMEKTVMNEDDDGDDDLFAFIYLTLTLWFKKLRLYMVVRLCFLESLVNLILKAFNRRLVCNLFVYIIKDGLVYKSILICFVLFCSDFGYIYIQTINAKQ